MKDYTTIPAWGDLIDGLIIKGKSVAIGVFDLKGELLDANWAMIYFLDIDSKEKKPINSFVNPEFSVFAADSHSGKIFEGFLTIGNSSDVSYSLEATVFRRDHRILVFAEANVPELFEGNRRMSQLNQEVNNLQRQLIKEKMTLQDTLKELMDTQQMLIHSENMNAMSQLVAGVAHEVNNPISFVYSNVFSLDKYIGNIVHSYTELEQLIQTKCNEELIDLAREIRKKNDLDFLIDDITDITTQSKIGLERVKTIIEDLRRFSKLDEAEMKSIDLIQNISSTILIAGLELRKRNILYKLIAPEKLMVECYPGQLNQALLNLILNAAHAIEADGNLTITVTETEHDVTISVLDDGCGIPPEIKDKIFDPFFTTKPVGSGTGIGLSITHKIITEMHKGTIQMESTPGEGTCFILSIPKQAYEIKGKE